MFQIYLACGVYLWSSLCSNNLLGHALYMYDHNLGVQDYVFSGTMARNWRHALDHNNMR